MIILNISTNNSQRGSGFWKLNTSLLKDESYVNLIKETFHETREEYTGDETVGRTLLMGYDKVKNRCRFV